MQFRKFSEHTPFWMLLRVTTLEIPSRLPATASTCGMAGLDKVSTCRST